MGFTQPDQERPGVADLAPLGLLGRVRTMKRLHLGAFDETDPGSSTFERFASHRRQPSLAEPEQAAFVDYQ